ncbi:MAG: hypothetical protein ABIJ20_02485 [Nanoarchaeota archaeon]|nr:hypothetical protein [Nanoarchaeota archaeon]MBU1444876.1 hypothetical protein [Nanoarchaeota archaeon]MBU2420674.1 hypothetical protein [Nanoarchaeota archaeon]MBU2475506.1 hypothetical protein [Nanoarchaeota archaeon]
MTEKEQNPQKHNLEELTECPYKYLSEPITYCSDFQNLCKQGPEGAVIIDGRCPKSKILLIDNP